MILCCQLFSKMSPSCRRSEKGCASRCSFLVVLRPLCGSSPLAPSPCVNGTPKDGLGLRFDV